MNEDKQIDINELGLLSAMTQGQQDGTYTMEIPLNYKAVAGEPLPNGENKASKEDITEAVKTVYDPEIPINVYDLGLIYDIKILDNGNVDIDMSLTAPGCPVAGILPQQVADVVSLVEGVGKVTVTIVWEPAWSIERMTEEGRAIMELI